MRTTVRGRPQRDVRALLLSEYALLLFPVTVLAFVIVKAFGQNIGGLYGLITELIATACRGC